MNEKGELFAGHDHTTVRQSVHRINGMNPVSSPQSNPPRTAAPGPMVPASTSPCLSPDQQKRLARLIDHRRKSAAITAGLDLEICTMLGDRDGAQRARKEMESQTGARIAARQSGCFFDELGERDAAAVHGSAN